MQLRIALPLLALSALTMSVPVVMASPSPTTIAAHSSPS